jgi:hypothetical protein
LLAPVLAVGVAPLVAAKLVGLVSAMAVLVALERLLRTVEITSATRTITLLGTVPFLLQAAFTWISPDLLVAAPLLVVTERLIRGVWLQGPAAAFVTGVAGGAAYLAKLYALPVVAVAIAGAVVLASGRNPGAARRRGAVLVAGLLLGVGGWATVLTVTTDAPTAGTAGGVNTAVLVPGSAGSPVLHAGLFRPPHPRSVSAWEAPSRLVRPDSSAETGVASDVEVAGEQAAVSGERLRGLTANVGPNLARTWSFVTGLWGVGVLVLVGAGRVAWRPEGSDRGRLLALGAVAAVWAGGLQLLVAHPRYLWPAALLLTPFAAVVLDRARRPVGVVLAAGALLVAWLPSSLAAIDEHREHGTGAVHLADALDDVGVRPGDGVAADGRWNLGTTTCFHLGCRFHGVTADTDDGAIKPEVRPSGWRAHRAAPRTADCPHRQPELNEGSSPSWQTASRLLPSGSRTNAP